MCGVIAVPAHGTSGCAVTAAQEHSPPPIAGDRDYIVTCGSQVSLLPCATAALLLAQLGHSALQQRA